MKFWGWFAQRISGLALVLLLGMHIYLTHFAAAGDAITYGGVQERLSMPSVFIVDILLLYLGLFHGLYGLRVVVTDLVPSWNNKVFTLVLMIGGLWLCIYGTITLAVLTAGVSL
jgi:succinate dehydrogenase / fumarate reductase membrane anchor subunit